LCREQPIEGVAMMEGQRRDEGDVAGIDGELPECVCRKLIGDEAVE
jgi:hypothetical protein